MKRLIPFFLAILIADLSATAQMGRWEVVPSLPSGEGLTGIASPAESEFVAVGGYGRVVRSTDGGDTWTDVPSGLDAVWESGLHDLSFGTPLTGTAVGSSGGVIHTTNGGGEWSRGSVGVEGYLSSVFFLNEDFGVVSSPFFLKTRDGGKSWEQRIFSFEGAIQDVVMLDTLLGFAVGPSGFSGAGTIFKTENGGESWDHVGTEGLDMQQLYQITFADREHGLIVGSKGTVIRTENGGETWSLALSGVTADLFSVAMRDQLQGVAVGADGTIIRTTDGGKTWRQEDSPTPSALTGVDIDAGGIAVAVGGVESGIILRSDPVPSGVRAMNEAGEAMFSVSPNPASGDVRVAWEWRGLQASEKGNEGEIVVRDLLGKEVKRFALSGNTGSVLWDTAGLPTGVYFITLGAGERRETKRIVVGEVGS